jgi:hypothetical protein
MRLGVVLIAMVLAGCASTAPEGPNAAPTLETAPPSKRAAPSDRRRGASPPEVRLDESVSGKVLFVNAALRFLVMDFPVRRLPVLDQRLNVYRNGQKVGQVKVTGPARDTNIAGDITAGEAQPGDEVRED